MNPEKENQNTLYAWATGKLAMFTIGLFAGYALYRMGVIQSLTGKLFRKKEEQNKSEASSY
ncbi:protein of unknown function [endosymbiont DhMRE of Dentiscutata heterogama]|uniref:hypothetical protein n=1 Tax=endosymbiont DhMRE of Dentiscutata heterogama TaxID=1609546 RepID=UPI000629D4E2|nr:hypothetical protein [endosymbiont DhMRE of Dentiscutata heterogama]CFW93066.1 protein of unknown function [endosymbiont DhMRE of Dentiscutata heterogama]